MCIGCTGWSHCESCFDSELRRDLVCSVLFTHRYVEYWRECHFDRVLITSLASRTPTPHSNTGTIGDSSQGNACENNVELRIVSRPSCDLKCDVGYEPSSSVVTCSSDAVNGVTAAQTNLICNEYTCSAITYPVETMSGSCTDPLTSVSSTSCELSCIPGYSGT